MLGYGPTVSDSRVWRKCFTGTATISSIFVQMTIETNHFIRETFQIERVGLLNIRWKMTNLVRGEPTQLEENLKPFLQPCIGLLSAFKFSTK